MTTKSDFVYVPGFGKEFGQTYCTVIKFTKNDMKLYRGIDGKIMRCLAFKNYDGKESVIPTLFPSSNVVAHVLRHKELWVPLFQVCDGDIKTKRDNKTPEKASRVTIVDLSLKCLLASDLDSKEKVYLYICINEEDKEYGIFVSEKKWKPDFLPHESVNKNIPKSKLNTRCVSKKDLASSTKGHECDPKCFNHFQKPESGLVGLQCVSCGQKFIIAASGDNPDYVMELERYFNIIEQFNQ